MPKIWLWRYINRQFAEPVDENFQFWWCIVNNLFGDRKSRCDVHTITAECTFWTVRSRCVHLVIYLRHSMLMLRNYTWSGFKWDLMSILMHVIQHQSMHSYSFRKTMLIAAEALLKTKWIQYSRSSTPQIENGQKSDHFKPVAIFWVFFMTCAFTDIVTS